MGYGSMSERCGRLEVGLVYRHPVLPAMVAPGRAFTVPCSPVYSLIGLRTTRMCTIRAVISIDRSGSRSGGRCSRDW
jgi:hypothetical protein